MTKNASLITVEECWNTSSLFQKVINFLYVFHSTQKVGEWKFFIKELQQIKARMMIEL